MRKIYVLFLILMLPVCMYFCVANPVLFSTKADSASFPVHPDTLEKHVRALSGTSVPRNSINLKGLEEAKKYIVSELKIFGYTNITEQTYKADSNLYANIIVSLGPKDKPVIVVGAHYDVCMDQPGADDNASGVAGLLEIARFLKNKEPELKYRVEMVFYTLEEPPFFRTEYMGSAVHAQSLFKSKTKVKGMICLEMIGYYSDRENSQEYPLGFLKWFYPDKANYIAVVGKLGQGRFTRKVKKLMSNSCETDVCSINAPASLPGIDFSDHLNYWKYGYTAVMITNTSFYRNKNYHEKTDTPETLDYVRMSEVVKGSANAILKIAYGK